MEPGVLNFLDDCAQTEVFEVLTVSKCKTQGSRGSFGFVWFQKSKKEPQSGSCGVGSSAVRFLAVQETVRFYECDSCAT